MKLRLSTIARRGFSLVEVALAVTIVSIVLLAAVGLLLPAQRAIQDVLTADQATRLRAEIEKEFSFVRPGETYDSGFAKAYQFLRNGDTKEGLLAAFFYRAVLPDGEQSTLEGGRLRPFTDGVDDLRPGEDYVIQAAVMPLTEMVATFDSEEDFRDALEGRLFVVRLTYLNGLVGDDPDGDGEGETTADLAFKFNAPSKFFPEAVIPAKADFYEADDLDDPAAIFERIEKGVVKPLLSLNLGFNR